MVALHTLHVTAAWGVAAGAVARPLLVAAAAATDAPQLGQNSAPGASAVPQTGHLAGVPAAGPIGLRRAGSRCGRSP